MTGTRGETETDRDQMGHKRLTPSVGQVEWETLQWVSCYNTEWLHGAIGHRPPQKMEADFYENVNELDKVA